MIIYEGENSFIMISQHEHAKVSGEIAQNWKDEFFYGIDRKEEVVLGIYEHDRGWIDLDAVPLWNDEQQKPYSFIDFPLEAKVTCYKKGINEVEKMNEYASLICSLHYASFFQNDVTSTGRQYLMEEKKRQQYLLNVLGIEDKENILRYHLNMLRFCDNLSLFICLNQPGVNEHPFFRDGIPQTFPFSNNKQIHTQWMNPSTVALSIFPLENELQVQIRLKEVEKEDIKLNGLRNAYTNTPYSKRTVKFTKK